MAEIKATLTKKDERFLDLSLNGQMWKVIVYMGTPLALYQGLNMLFTILDTMMAAHISKELVSTVAYLSQLISAGLRQIPRTAFRKALPR